MKIKFLAACTLLVILLTTGACAAANAQDAAISGGPDRPVYLGEVAITNSDDFAQNSHIQREVDINKGDVLRVTLFSNVTTGFSWDENARVADKAVLKQVKHQDIAAAAKGLGAGGSEQWDFETLKAGTTTVHLEYSRPWAGGEKGIWTFDLTVTVK